MAGGRSLPWLLRLADAWSGRHFHLEKRGVVLQGLSQRSPDPLVEGSSSACW